MKSGIVGNVSSGEADANEAMPSHTTLINESNRVFVMAVSVRRPFLFSNHPEIRISERFAHQSKGLCATEVVVAGVRRAAFPEGGFRGGNEI